MAAPPTTPPRTPPPFDPPAPLGQEQLARIAHVGDRLRSEFAAMLEALPAGAETTAGLARTLGLRRPICQRLVTAIRRTAGGADVARAVPGVRGLTQVIDAAARRGCDRALTASARAAVREYAALLKDLGGSQTRFLALMDAHDRDGAGPREVPRAAAERRRIRRTLFDGMCAATGRWCDALVHLAVVAPSSAAPDAVDHTFVAGHVALRSAAGAMPIARMFRAGAAGLNHAGDHQQLSGDAFEGDTPGAVLRSFSSDPLPNVTSRPYRRGVMQFVDLPPASDRGVDYFLADRIAAAPHPAVDPDRMINYGIIPDVPARAQIIAVHLHKSVARACVASAGCYTIGLRGTVATTVAPDGQIQSRPPSERWFDRLPDTPTIEYLGPDLAQTRTDAYPRMEELTRYLFTRIQADPEDYIGYRCIIEYPIWATETVMSFDFRDKTTRDHQS